MWTTYFAAKQAPCIHQLEYDEEIGQENEQERNEHGDDDVDEGEDLGHAEPLAKSHACVLVIVVLHARREQCDRVECESEYEDCEDHAQISRATAHVYAFEGKQDAY
jgi:hypothetical protein